MNRDVLQGYLATKTAQWGWHGGVWTYVSRFGPALLGQELQADVPWIQLGYLLGDPDQGEIAQEIANIAGWVDPQLALVADAVAEALVLAINARKAPWRAVFGIAALIGGVLLATAAGGASAANSRPSRSRRT